MIFRRFAKQVNTFISIVWTIDLKHENLYFFDKGVDLNWFISRQISTKSIFEKVRDQALQF